MTDQQSDYDDWAWLYNQTLGLEYGREKMAFLERAFLPTLPVGGRVLDLCCGTGQLIAPLLQRGYQVTGLDGSAGMLRFARENAPEASYMQADARDFRSDEAFDGVLSTSASLNHISGLADLERVFACVRNVLHDGGVFVFDINHPAQMKRYWRGQAAEGEIKDDHAWLITPQYDADAAQGTFTVDIFRRPADATRTPLKAFIARLASKRRASRLKLGLLARFSRFQPEWEHRATAYPVHGHDVEAVRDLLRRLGFDAEFATIAGDPLDDNHSAYFVCRKLADAGHADPRQKTETAA
ncbi:class I SAM-dependent methyltransferase [Aquamicrobium sp. LC103]|uniref:class I SAM-dependent DNA methyltransferase n=1 Tax=Aquamicrobium sp. LC103 TaxID=1120658 RepID=UPI00063E6F7E|nr:class I SAM-dependent methyltransferase [Aquamicrobium sp. LC103]TKT78143.1 class I SAM-dependent methyltransferase [Aquamicrobium sp. LC103]